MWMKVMAGEKRGVIIKEIKKVVHEKVLK